MATTSSSNACSPTLQYEVIPSSRVPLLDLSKSMGSEMVALFRHITCRPSAPAHQHEPSVEHTTWARATLAAYGTGHVLAAIACFVPASVGGPLGITGLALTLPGSIYSLLMLRFDVVKLLLLSYDFWFYTFVNTAAAVLICNGFGDTRACIVAMLWMGNSHTIFVDANTKLVCYLVQASVVTAILNAVVLLAISSGSISNWDQRAIQFRVKTNDHSVDCDSLISNGLTTMMVLLARNIHRRHWELALQKKINCPMLRCLNLRLRVAFKPADPTEVALLQASSLGDSTYYLPPFEATRKVSLKSPMVQMWYIRYPGYFVATDTFYPVMLAPLRWSHWERLAFACTGAAGLACTTAVYVVYPAPSAQPLGIIGLCCTMVFVGVCMGLLQRRAFQQIMRSFDFIFLSFQLSFGLWCASQLFLWGVRSIAIASMWLWLHWVITIDALSPLMKRKIGFNTKFLVVPVLGLFIASEIGAFLEVTWLDRWGLTDQVLISFTETVNVRLMPFFASRAVMSFLWAVRLLWRVLTSVDDSDAVILQGRLAYMHISMETPVPRQPPTVAHLGLDPTTKVTTAASRAQVVPVG